MSLKNKTIFYTQPKHIFLDVNGAIATFFSTYNTTYEDEFEHPSYTSDKRSRKSACKKLVKYLIENRSYLEDFILLDDSNGEISSLFPNNCLSEEAMKSLKDYSYQTNLELICE